MTTTQQGYYIQLETDVTLPIPPEVGRCPYCDESLEATFECWAQQEDGTWAAEEIALSCPNSDGYGGGDDDHYVMPYVYLLPVETRLLDWVNQRYRFRIDDHG